jgi:uncharacterized membrane protein YtjA (UPF0391 family)
MFNLVVTLLIIALIAAVLGFGGIAFAAAEIAKVIFFVALVRHPLQDVPTAGASPTLLASASIDPSCTDADVCRDANAVVSSYGEGARR